MLREGFEEFKIDWYLLWRNLPSLVYQRDLDLLCKLTIQKLFSEFVSNSRDQLFD